MSNSLAGINPKVLTWARERFGYTIDEAAQAAGRPPSELKAWEAGTSVPTYAQLEKLAYKVYKRPIALFYFPSPPPEQDPEHAFRTLPDFEIEALLPDTRFLLRRAQALQLSLEELSGGTNQAEQIVFRDLRVSPDRSIVKTAQRLREDLGVSMDRQASWSSNENAFKAWRAAMQDVGIYVF